MSYNFQLPAPVSRNCPQTQSKWRSSSNTPHTTALGTSSLTTHEHDEMRRHPTDSKAGSVESVYELVRRLLLLTLFV